MRQYRGGVSRSEDVYITSSTPSRSEIRRGQKLTQSSITSAPIDLRRFMFEPLVQCDARIRIFVDNDASLQDL